MTSFLIIKISYTSVGATGHQKPLFLFSKAWFAKMRFLRSAVCEKASLYCMHIHWWILRYRYIITNIYYNICYLWADPSSYLQLYTVEWYRSAIAVVHRQDVQYTPIHLPSLSNFRVTTAHRDRRRSPSRKTVVIRAMVSELGLRNVNSAPSIATSFTLAWRISAALQFVKTSDNYDIKRGFLNS